MFNYFIWICLLSHIMFTKLNDWTNHRTWLCSLEKYAMLWPGVQPCLFVSMWFVWSRHLMLLKQDCYLLSSVSGRNIIIFFFFFFTNLIITVRYSQAAPHSTCQSYSSLIISPWSFCSSLLCWENIMVTSKCALSVIHFYSAI